MCTQKDVAVNLISMRLTDREGLEHEMCPHEYWYLAPTRSSWSIEDGYVLPLQFGLLLHNALKGQGLVPAMDDLMRGVPPSSVKTGVPKQAEEMFEDVRASSFQHRPSRYRSHFLSYDENVAKARQDEWGWANRRLVKCYALLSSAKFHYADVRLYEQAACGNLSKALAEEYWKDYDEANIPRKHVEVLADAALYFPEWQEFDELNFADLTNWGKNRHQKQGG